MGETSVPSGAAGRAAAGAAGGHHVERRAAGAAGGAHTALGAPHAAQLHAFTVALVCSYLY